MAILTVQMSTKIIFEKSPCVEKVIVLMLVRNIFLRKILEELFLFVNFL